MSHKFLALVALGLIMQAAPVLADNHKDGEHKRPGMFEKHDTDGDGVISKSEFLSHAEERFSKMDADGDGNVTAEEGKAAHEAMREKHKEMRGKRKEAHEKRKEAREDGVKIEKPSE